MCETEKALKTKISLEYFFIEQNRETIILFLAPKENENCLYLASLKVLAYNQLDYFLLDFTCPQFARLCRSS